MKKFWPFILGAIAMVIIALSFSALDAQMAKATIGTTYGMAPPRLPSLTTVKAGPIWYNPGDGHRESHTTTLRSESAQVGETALDDFLHPERERARLKKLQCDRDRFGYVMRHGVTTPGPLKGFHGCAKYAMDAAYWRHRRNEPSLRVQTDPLTVIQQSVIINVHDLFIR